MKRTLKHAAIFAVAAVFVLCLSFAAFAQAPSSGAKPDSGALPVYSFTARDFIATHVPLNDRSDCWCGNSHAECIKAFRFHKPQFVRSRSSFISAVTEIREIDLDGLKKLLLRDPKDTRPLLVNFWATWCDGCREEFPDLVKIDNDYRAKGLNFLSITLDEVADKPRAVDFLKEMKATMPVVLLNVNDPEPAIHAVDEKWDGALPATFLYDHEGKLVFKYFGKIKPAELRAAIDKEVGSKQ